MESYKIGTFIKECRKDLKLTQEELGEKLGVSSKSVSRWENNVTMPDLSLISSIANVLNVEISELLKGRKMNEEELIELRETIDKYINKSKQEEKKILNLFNKSFITILILSSLIIINNLFNIVGVLIGEKVHYTVNSILVIPIFLITLKDFYKNKYYNYIIKNQGSK